MKIIFYITFIITSFLITFSVLSNEMESKNKTTKEIIDTRMKKMTIINSLSQKIYKNLASTDFGTLKEYTIQLKDSAIDFKKLFPINSKGGKAKNLIWENKMMFDEYNDNFLADINLMLINIDKKDSKFIKKSFNNMSSNCSSCHKKFKNK